MTRIMPIVAEQRGANLSAGSFVTARCCLAAVFLYSGITKLAFSSAGLREFAALGIPLPALILSATIVVQIGAGLALAIGWRSRAAALTLAAFTGLATLVGHPFWAFEGADFHRQLTTALEHLAIIGGLVLIASVGSGPISLQPRKDLP